MADIVVKARTQPTYIYQEWPKMVFGPNREQVICGGPDDVPRGYSTRPNGPSEPDLTPAPESQQVSPPADEVDASGNVWNVDINTSNMAKTKDGLWKLKPGKSRPKAIKFDL